MLVVTRKSQEKIVLPTYGITITVLKARRGRVRLGIEAPSHIKIVRAELLEKPKNRKSPSEPGTEEGATQRPEADQPPQAQQSEEQSRPDQCQAGTCSS